MYCSFFSDGGSNTQWVCTTAFNQLLVSCYTLKRVSEIFVLWSVTCHNIGELCFVPINSYLFCFFFWGGGGISCAMGYSSTKWSLPLKWKDAMFICARRKKRTVPIPVGITGKSVGPQYCFAKWFAYRNLELCCSGLCCSRVACSIKHRMIRKCTETCEFQENDHVHWMTGVRRVRDYLIPQPFVWWLYNVMADSL